jgi:UDP-2,3-diacylglucosamine pyrophosphatase LpxH
MAGESGHRLFIDVGVWGRYEEGFAHTDFGLVSGKYVLLCSWLNMEEQDIKDPESNKAKPGRNLYKGIYTPAIIAFFQALRGKYKKKRGFVIQYCTARDQLIDKNKLTLFLPDLHLHLFKESVHDDFVYNDRESLEEELAKLIVTGQEVGATIIQVGDCFEIWEAHAHLIAEAYEHTKNDQVAPYVKKLGAVGIWNSERVKEEIIERYPQIFKRKKYPFHWIRGNHDNMLDNNYYQKDKDIGNVIKGSKDKLKDFDYQCGFNNCIWVEHGHHPYDKHNNNEDFDKKYGGYWVTKGFTLNIEPFSRKIAQMVDLRPAQQLKVKEIFDDGHKDIRYKNVRLVVMGHTHEAMLFDYDEKMKKDQERLRKLDAQMRAMKL